MPVTTHGLALAALALVVTACGGGTGGGDRDDSAPGTINPGTETQHEVVVDETGRTRTYTLYVPTSANGDNLQPLVLLYHGGGLGSPQTILNSTGMRDAADAEGFVVAALRARNAVWNAGVEGRENGGNDIAFTEAVINRVDEIAAVDLNRVYAAGFSQGGAMVYRLACQLTDRIAAIGVVSGFSSRTAQNRLLPAYECLPQRAVPLIHIHGLADTCVRYEGGAGTGLNQVTERTPIPETIADWAARNGCSDTSAPSDRPSSTACDIRSDCDGESAVRLCTIGDQGHVWPGQAQYSLHGQCNGRQTGALEATSEFWEFVQEYALSN